MEWLSHAATAIAAITGTLIIVDRIQKYRRRIGRDAKFWLEPGTKPGADEWTPSVLDPTKPEFINVEITLYNNSGEPVVLEEWVCEGVPLPIQRKDVYPPTTVAPGETRSIATSMLPRWDRWDQEISAGRTSPDDGKVRISLIALMRASSRRERIRVETYSVPHETIRNNAVKALAISTDTSAS